MSKLIFGCWTIGKWHWSEVNDKQSKEALLCAFNSGITMFDTAPMYGFGHSEKLLGETFQKNRQDIFIMSKCGLDWENKQNTFFFNTVFQGKNYSIYRNLSSSRIKKECDLSLKRLGTDYIDLYQIHWKDDAVSLIKAASTLQILQNEGKIRHWGVCNMNTGDLDLLVKNNLKPYSLQFKYSLLHRKPEKSVIPYCKKHNIKLYGYSPFEQGLLAGAVNSKRKLDSEDGRNWWDSDKIEKIDFLKNELVKICQKYNTSPSALILSVTSSISKCDGIITGMRTVSQVNDNIKFSNLQLDNKEVETIANTIKNIY